MVACKIISKAKLENLSTNDIISKNSIVKTMQKNCKRDLKHKVKYLYLNLVSQTTVVVPKYCQIDWNYRE